MIEALIVGIAATVAFAAGMYRDEALGRTKANLRRVENPVGFWFAQAIYALVAVFAIALWL